MVKLEFYISALETNLLPTTLTVNLKENTDLVGNISRRL
jgi:hypothetical protein